MQPFVPSCPIQLCELFVLLLLFYVLFFLTDFSPGFFPEYFADIEQTSLTAGRDKSTFASSLYLFHLVHEWGLNPKRWQIAYFRSNNHQNWIMGTGTEGWGKGEGPESETSFWGRPSQITMIFSILSTEGIQSIDFHMRTLDAGQICWNKRNLVLLSGLDHCLVSLIIAVIEAMFCLFDNILDREVFRKLVKLDLLSITAVMSMLCDGLNY